MAKALSKSQITAEIAARWDFPDVVIEGLRRAGQPMAGDTFSRLAGIVHLASYIADNDSPGPGTLSDLPVAVVLALQLDLPKLAASMPDAESLSDISTLQG